MVKDIFSQIAEYNIRQASPTPFKTVLLVVDMQKYFGEIAEPILGNDSMIGGRHVLPITFKVLA